MRYSVATAAFMVGAVTAVPALQNYGPAPVVSQITDGQIQVPTTVPGVNSGSKNNAYGQSSAVTTPSATITSQPSPSTLEETKYSVSTVIITSCHSDVLNCPASSILTTTTIVPIPQITTTPSAVSEATSSPIVVPPTTISSVVVPQTYISSVVVPQTSISSVSIQTSSSPVVIIQPSSSPIALENSSSPITPQASSIPSTISAPNAAGTSSETSTLPSSPAQSGQSAIGNSPIGATSSESQCVPVTVYSTITVSPSAYAAPPASTQIIPAGPSSGAGNSPIPASPAIPVGSSPAASPASSGASSNANSPILATSVPSPYQSVPSGIASGTFPAGSSGAGLAPNPTGSPIAFTGAASTVGSSMGVAALAAFAAIFLA